MSSFEAEPRMASWAWPTGSTKVLAILGDPVEHSLSPVIHNSGFRRLGLDCVYVALRVPDGEIGKAVEALRFFGVIGFSVTMPHKEAIIPYLDEVTDRAKKLQSVNFVYRQDDRFIGDSTDGQALVEALRDDFELSVHGKSVAVLGSGGAGRAISLALADNGAKEVYVISRNLLTASVAAELAGSVGYVGVNEDLERVSVIVNATPIGMAGTNLAGLTPIRADQLREGQYVYDIVYHPHVTPLVEVARSRGIAASSGVSMLVRLSTIAFEKWTGVEAPIEEIRSAVRAETLRRG